MGNFSKRLRKFLLPVLVAAPIIGGFAGGDELRKVFNDVSQASTPVDQRHLIVGPFPDNNPFIAAEDISRTGDVPVHLPWGAPRFFSQGNMRIDWQSDDAFTRAFASMEQKAAARITATPALMALKAKHDWTPADRLAWDSRTAQIIADVVGAQPGLNRYRTDGDGKLPPLHRLNDLSDDITHNTMKHADDCKEMSVIKVVLQERMAERFLPPANRTRYFYTTGEVEFRSFYSAPAGHAYILAERDGQLTGIIEATGFRDVFHQPARPYRFSDIVNGTTMVTKDGAVYGNDFTHAEADRLRTAFGIKNSPKSTAKQFKASKPLLPHLPNLHVPNLQPPKLHPPAPHRNLPPAH